MIRPGKLGFLFGLLSASAIAQAPVEPWKAVSKWNLNIGNAKCTIGRTFGSGSRELSLGFNAEMIGGTQILIVMPAIMYGRLASRVTVSAPGVPPIEAEFTTLGQTGPSTRLIAITIDRAVIGAFLSAKQISIASGGTSFTVEQDGSPAVVSAIDKCQTDLLRAWKIDPAEVRNDVHQVDGPPSPRSSWITSNDYPQAAWAAREQGEVMIVWRVETNGRVEDCRVVQSSGSKSLDSTSCNIIRDRAQFRPYLDRDGHPAVAWKSLRFRWALPN
jgi:TonB family protein